LRWSTIILGGCAVILTWLVVSRSLAAYLADVAPHSALWLNPRQPDALINLADRSINASVNVPGSAMDVAGQASQQQNDTSVATTGVPDSAATASENLNQAFEIVDQNRSVDLPEIRARLESALMNEPLNARALRILGQLADTSKDNDDASKYMTAAARLSLHEGIAVYWLMRKSTAANDYKAAISYADALLRTDPGLGPYVVPILAHFAEQQASKDLVKTLLESNPPWRGLFFGALPDSVTDARTPLEFLLALSTTPTPPTSAEIGRYLDFLIRHRFYDLAYYTWLQFLPADELRNAGLLFNGSFEVAPSGLPFDWVITQGSGVTIDIVPRRDKNNAHALLVDFLYGRVDYHSVSELVLLPPGTYQFAGQYNGKIAGPRGLKWRIVCAGESNTRIGESPMISGVTSAWKDIEFIFTVPAADCRAQYVRLDLDARMASEQLVSGSMLFDELHISRVAKPPNSQ
jgi:tetratricopeptide (TPR) repeat protein